MEYDFYELDALENFEKIINNFELNLNKVSVGRANPAILSSIKVMYYDTLTPLMELVNVSVPEPRQLLIKPFDAQLVKEIANAITHSSLGVNPVNEGHQIRITFPEVTSERRRELAKSIGHYSEQAKIGIRQVRQDVNKNIKSDEELTEDEQKEYLDQIQKTVDKQIFMIEEKTAAKTKELMTI